MPQMSTARNEAVKLFLFGGRFYKISYGVSVEKKI